MATKKFYATGSFKYQHRMLKAGDPVEMDAPTARLYNALDKITDKKPRVASVATPPSAPPAAPPAPRKRTRKAAAKK